MRPRYNLVLSQISTALREGGPRRREVVEGTPTFDHVPVIEPGSHLTGAAGVGDAVNVPDMQDRFELYIQNLVDSLCMQYGCSDDAALDCITDAAEDLVAMGLITAVPTDADPVTLSVWAAQAKTAGLGALAYKACAERVGGYPDPDGRGNDAQGQTFSVGAYSDEVTTQERLGT